MGMSASQARLLSLQARQSNLEYQGQQINQERTILSQQATALYNSLLAMNVPTPPSTSDFSTVEYSGTDGASTFTLGNIIPNGNNTYTVEQKYTMTGHYLESAGTAIVTDVPATIKVSEVTARGTSSTSYAQPDDTIGSGNTVANGTTIMSQADSSYELQDGEQFFELKEDANGNSTFVAIEASDVSSVASGRLYVLKTAQNADESSGTEANYDPATSYDMTGVTAGTYTSGGISQSSISSYYIKNGSTLTKATEADFDRLSDGTYQLKSSVQGTLVERNSSGDITVDNPDSTNPNITKYVEGYACMSVADAKDALGTSYSSYIQAIRDAFTEYADADKYSDDEVAQAFSVYFTKSEGSTTQVPHFMLTSDLNSNLTNVNGNSYVDTYNYLANGTYTSTETKEDCLLTFDTTGRITEIRVPTGYSDNGEVSGYKTISLTAQTGYDEAAYQDAYNQYEYEQYLYDKKNQEINAQTSIIQTEDRNLELKLQRLDNERTQITTEIEAVDKVINDNIEASYKTFSG